MIFSSPYPDVTVPDAPFAEFVLRHAQRLAEKPALIDGASGRTLTYGQLDDAVRRVAAGLARRGFQRGDTLAIYASNQLEFVIPFLAAALLGGVTTTVNPLYTVDELSAQLTDSGARYIFTVPASVDKALEAQQRVGLQEVFLFDEATEPEPALIVSAEVSHAEEQRRGLWGWLRRNSRPMAASLRSGVTDQRAPTIPFAILMKDKGQASQVAVDVSQDVVALPYSSGTTGLAKGVMLTHRNLVANLCQMTAMGIVTEEDTVIGVLPFFHIYGITVILSLSLANGATVVSMPRFNLQQFLQVLQDRQVTVGFVAPPIALALAKQPIVDQYDLSALRLLMSAAAPLGKEIQEVCAARLQCLFIQGWGMTETSPDVTMEPRDPTQVKAGAAGVCVPNSACKVIDIETGAELGPNEQGEICARGPQIMKGYLNNPAATAQTLELDGWLHTGDIGYFDEDGHLYVVDRLKELIKYKGYQVAPAELEAVLLAHPAVADVAVIPLKDDEAGDVPKAFIVLKPDATATADELMSFVAERVAPYKKVRQVEFIDAIPKSPSGKILRRVLIKQERGG